MSPTVEPRSRASIPMRSVDRRWKRLRDRATPWVAPDGRTVVVAPHPDDESLSTGGLIAAQRRLGRDVVIVAVTDGDAAYSTSGDPELARVRCIEQESALADLGVDPSGIVRLRHVDSQVDRDEDRLVTDLCEIVRPGDLVVAPWLHDHHHDHEAVARAATRTVADRGAGIVYSLFWAWHRGDPESITRGYELVAFEVPPEQFVAKQTAIGRHVSQLSTIAGDGAILDDALLEPTRWASEYFVVGVHA